MIAKLLFYFYNFSNKRKWRNFIIVSVLRLEGGEMFSKTLRRIFATYHGIYVDLYSYGCFYPNNIARNTTIGRFCSFAENVTIFNANHPLERKSLHPFFYNPHFKFVKRETISRSSINIGHDVWIGKNAIITPSVSCINNGAVIAAGSVVTKNVPAYAVVAGNPAKIIKYRFPVEIQKTIEKSRWWEKTIEELRPRLNDFLEPMVKLDDKNNSDLPHCSMETKS